MYKYRLHYLRDGDDGNWKTYESEEEVSIGDVLQLACGFYHCVINSSFGVQIQQIIPHNLLNIK